MMLTIWLSLVGVKTALGSARTPATIFNVTLNLFPKRLSLRNDLSGCHQYTAVPLTPTRSNLKSHRPRSVTWCNVSLKPSQPDLCAAKQLGFKPHPPFLSEIMSFIEKGAYKQRNKQANKLWNIVGDMHIGTDSPVLLSRKKPSLGEKTTGGILLRSLAGERKKEVRCLWL